MDTDLTSPANAMTFRALPAPPALDLAAVHPDATFMRILGVNYVHVKTHEQGDLYVTEFGVPFMRHLLPENWLESEWFRQKRTQLDGSGTVYRLPTKPVEGHLRKSIDLVVKWSRVGQDVPLDTFMLTHSMSAEFNSPFEEFSLVHELRQRRYRLSRKRILTQKPLAIYVPPDQHQLWQTGRSLDRIKAKVRRHPSVEIDTLRSYILIYGWIDGVDAVAGWRGSFLELSKQHSELAAFTREVEQELAEKGFAVADHKPTHLIVRHHKDGKLRRRNGRTVYAIVDYELLVRTAAHEDEITVAKRQDYLVRQRDRFLPRENLTLPPQLQRTNICGLDYITGICPSTGGRLWVLGSDPELFPYFLPERWRLKQILLSESGRTFYTRSKDQIHMVWKVSRVGEALPEDVTAGRTFPNGRPRYMNPFEKFAMAYEFQKRGIETVYPRAVYMTGGPAEFDGLLEEDPAADAENSHALPAGVPPLAPGHDFISIWGYWRGLDEDQAVNDKELWTPIDVNKAAAKNVITDTLRNDILKRHALRLLRIGYEDLNFGGDHILLAYKPEGSVKVVDGFPEMHQCNFELMVKTGPRQGCITEPRP